MLLARKIKACTVEGRRRRNPVWPSFCVTPAGTSNEPDVQGKHTHTRHASERDPISITISMISFSFSRAFVNDCHAFREFSARLCSCSLSLSSPCGVPVVFTAVSESSAESQSREDVSL